ncbi:GMC family oxidoreductase [Rhodococcoides fascians]|uniref:GMC family oxidoreductase n=1 Tax=Rhodococcoides fascians TaxID=1828 RepID=UPI00050C970D|nr:GMC family oxidoreductase [Rhodococcus fascians]
MNTQDQHSEETADVLIVGAGASGAFAALELSQAGFKVVCLEQGDWTLRTDFAGASKEWELKAQKDWHPNPNKRARSADYPIDTSDSDVNPLMFNGVGGSTILYAAHWVRMLPSDFQSRSQDGVGDDWPITYEDLAPYYAKTEIAMGVSGLVGDPAYPDEHAYPNAPMPLNKIGLKAAQGLDKLGWHWWPGPQAISAKPYRHMQACVRRGTCLTGCPEGAKGSVDVTHWPDAIQAGTRLVTGARVREITTNAKGLATGAIYVDRNGVERRQKANVVIMAANGIGTARLLLLSESKAHPNGLGNSSGLVGRRLMMHPYAAATGVYDEPLESWLGPSGHSIQSFEFYETKADRGFVRGAKWQVMPSGGPLGLRAGYSDSPLEEAWGANFHRRVKKTTGHSFEWGLTAEDLPDDNNRVTLDSSLTDSDGIASPKIIYKSSENTTKLMEFNLARAKEAHEAAGATEVHLTPLMRDCGWHIMGTARMGVDSSDSVIDEWNRSHDVPNLYVIDGSAFVTSAGANPTATITALTLRAMEHLIANRADQEVPE